MYAPIRAKYNIPFTDEVNVDYEDATRMWGACSDLIFAWLYETNFTQYMYPYNSWDSCMETYRLLVSCGTNYIMPQGQWNNSGQTGFTDFKDYINSCAALNVNLDFSEIKEDYFAHYFREAAEPMLSYYDEINMYMRYLEETYPAEFNGGIYDSIAQSKFWPVSLLLHWQDLINEAYEAIEIYQNQKSLYEALKDHIDKESIFVRYALLTLHGGKFSESNLKTMQQQLLDDCNRLGVKRVGEGTTIDEIATRWGVE